jgi:cystathionine beta-lyase family protein involved in aluminum resistance
VNATFTKAVSPFGFPADLVDLAEAAFEEVVPAWAERDASSLLVGAKVLRCFADVGLSESHLTGTTGYGYNDVARDAYDALLAKAMDAPAAFARLQLVSGTHAIVATVNALLGPSGRLCSLTGAPYDTLQRALVQPLLDKGREGGAERYTEIPLLAGGGFDDYAIAHAMQKLPDVVFVQRSRGYASRPALSIAEIGTLVGRVRANSPSSIIVVDNCYSEFVELREPSAVGADVVVGSLIKNPGGGLAPAGAYIAGSEQFVEAVADKIFAPGLGRKVGPTLDTARLLFAGLHRAPKVVAESLKIMDFAAALFAKLGYAVDPKPGAPRYDIIQAIGLGDPTKLAAFTEGLQMMMPVNARAKPEPGPVPGYDDPVIMAAGSFIGGSTMELSCDAPLREPYEVYLQGGMDTTHGVIATMKAAQAVRGG